MKTSSITIQKELDAVGGERVAAGDEASLWRLGDGRLVVETNADPVWESESGFNTLAATIVAQAGCGLDYRSGEWLALSALVDWPDMWPEVDGAGCLTGLVITSGEHGFYNVDDTAMVSHEAARRDGWRIEDGYAAPAGPVDVELAEADETIRQRAGLEDIAGLEHPAMSAACQAYHAAVAEALAGDPRARRLNVVSPKGRRILHSQWCGAGFAYTQGAIGVMSGDLTADERQAISDADDAGRAAAANEIAKEDAAT